MSMSDPLLPNPTESESENAPAAAEPGPAAPGTPLTEEPDVLPDAQDDSEADDVSPAAPENPPFRTPEAGERLTASDLEDRS
jgi:hypothetical protein